LRLPVEVPVTLRLLERLEEWSAQLYRLDPERLRREQGLRAALLRRLLLATGAVALLYLGLGLAGVVAGRFFPYDALALLLAAAGCAWLLRRGHTATALVLPLVVFSHTASSVIGHYGVASPAAALLLPTILVCGLLVGGYFLATWAVICGLLVLVLGHREGAVSGAGGLWRPVLFWWALFAAEGWLVHLFSSHLERLLQLERGQKYAVLRTLGLLAADPHLDGLLGRSLDVVREQLGAGAVTLWRLDGAGESLWCAAATGAAAGATRLALTDLPDWKGLAVAGRAVRLTGPAVAGCGALAPPGAGEVVLVPLTVGFAPAGLLVAGYEEARRHAEERLELAEALALQLSLLLELVGLAERDRHAMMVEERNRMARDLHDTLAQGFTGVVVQLNAAGEVLAADPARAREHIAAARELARASLQEARRAVWALRPAGPGREGLAPRLERGARTLTAGTGIEVEIQTSGEARGVGAEAEWEALRIGQEAVANAVRHSGCRRINVRLWQGAGALRLEVEDDGKGGAAEEGAPGRGGLGLLGMRERAGRVGGRLEVHSPPGGPTRVTLAVSGSDAEHA
jgi:signal transduction histidine kinase